MKKYLLFLFSLFILFFILIPISEAKKGCCSRHNGVCGCNCCDGTPFSETCKSHYSECNYSNLSNQYNNYYSKNDCPINSHYSYSDEGCICNDGYIKSLNLNSCIIKEDCEEDGKSVFISRVIDGDTIEFICNGETEKVRIIGIDTPETVHPSKEVECFGKESSEKMNELTLNKTVILKKGKGSNNKGKYSRLIRYVEVDNIDVGAKMIKEGFAFSYKKYPHEKLDLYNDLERAANIYGKGLWKKGVCNYKKENNKKINGGGLTQYLIEKRKREEREKNGYSEEEKARLLSNQKKVLTLERFEKESDFMGSFNPFADSIDGVSKKLAKEFYDEKGVSYYGFDSFFHGDKDEEFDKFLQEKYGITREEHRKATTNFFERGFIDTTKFIVGGLYNIIN